MQKGGSQFPTAIKNKRCILTTCMVLRLWDSTKSFILSYLCSSFVCRFNLVNTAAACPHDMTRKSCKVNNILNINSYFRLIFRASEITNYLSVMYNSGFNTTNTKSLPLYMPVLSTSQHTSQTSALNITLTFLSWSSKWWFCGKSTGLPHIYL
jgi:hypothetical protein